MTIFTFSLPRTAITLAACALAGAAQATVVYDSTRQTPLPPNVSSQAYQAQQVSEFGDHVILAGTQRQLTTVTMTMSNWAYQSIYLSDPRYGGANQNNAGFLHNLTANLYGVDHSTATPGVGALLTSLTEAKLIPWRAEPSTSCSAITPGGANPYTSGGSCWNGLAFSVTFDFSAANIVLPNEVIFSMAHNTQNYGASPIGVNGPYNSVNFAYNSTTTVGMDAEADAIFWNTTRPGNNTTGINGVFSRDQDNSANGWLGYAPAFQINAVAAVPEASSVALMLAGLGVVGVLATKRRRVG
jgi:hypothetical protein